MSPLLESFTLLVDSKPKSTKKYALAALGLIGLAATLGAYYSLVLLPQQKKSSAHRAA